MVTYEGSRFVVNDLKLLMDTFHRVEFTGTWRRLFSRVKKHIIWGVLKSVTGMQVRVLHTSFLVLVRIGSHLQMLIIQDICLGVYDNVIQSVPTIANISWIILKAVPSHIEHKKEELFLSSALSYSSLMSLYMTLASELTSIMVLVSSYQWQNYNL